jgi:hypothetical protein
VPFYHHAQQAHSHLFIINNKSFDHKAKIGRLEFLLQIQVS